LFYQHAHKIALLEICRAANVLSMRLAIFALATRGSVATARSSDNISSARDNNMADQPSGLPAFALFDAA